MPWCARQFAVACALLASLLVSGVVQAANLYVVPDASKGGPGTDKAQPSGKLCAVLDAAKDGDYVYLAEGSYVLSAPCVVSKRRLSILGGYRPDFTTRDVFMSIARLTASGAPATLLRVEQTADDLLVEGVLFDGGQSAAYGATPCHDCLTGAYDQKATPALVLLDQSGRTRFRNVVFANAPGGAVSATVRASLVFEGVSIVNTRPFAVKVTGVCGYAAPRCVDLLVRGSTIVWTWRESIAEAANGGSAIVVGSGVSARVEHSVIAYSDHAAVEVETTENTELGVSAIVTFDNRGGDVLIAGQKALAITEVVAGGAIAGAPPFGRMERLALPWDIDYLNRFLGRASQRFYGARIAPNRAFLLSPAADAGLHAPSTSRLTYEAAVAGNTQAVQQVVQAAPDDDGKDDPKGKKKKAPIKKGKKGKGK